MNFIKVVKNGHSQKIDGNITYVVWKNESYVGQHYDWVFGGDAPKQVQE